MSAGLRVVGVDGLSVSVTIKNAAGSTTSAWSDAALTTPVSMPVTITSDTTFWLAGQSGVQVSMKVGGTELGPVPVQVSDGVVGTVPVPSDTDALKHIEASDLAVYAPVSATWLPNTAYKAGQMVVNAGQPWTANADFTSGASFNASNWTLVLPGAEIAASTLSTSYSYTSSFATITGWQVVVPANSGPVEVGVPGGVLLNCTTGTNAAGTSFSVDIKIVDEAAATIAYSDWKFYSSSATSQSWTNQIPLGRLLPNNASDKTYSVQAHCGQVGLNSCTATLFTSQSGFVDPTLRAIRR